METSVRMPTWFVYLFLAVVAFMAIDVACFCITGSSSTALLERTALRTLPCGEGESDVRPVDTLTDRKFAVMSIQNYSDYIGFEGKFSITDDGYTLHMEGSALCAPDFGVSIPPGAWAPVKASGFKVFECYYKGMYVREEIK